MKPKNIEYEEEDNQIQSILREIAPFFFKVYDEGDN